MTKLTFLYASVPLTKRIVKNRDGSITKDSYPHVANFTSKTHTVKTLSEMYTVIQAAVKDPAKPCLLKGTIQRELKHESRAGSTSSNTSTTWVCFDLDKAPFSSPDEFMMAMELQDVSYILQYSSSYKLTLRDKTLSCHIICMLDKAMLPSQLKAWLMHSNFSIGALRNALTLTNSTGSGLHYTLDVTLCQNDRLLYIAEPVFVNMTSPVKSEDRLKLVKRTQDTLPHTRIALKALDALTKEKRDIWNNLREAAGMKKVSVKATQQGEYTVQKGLGEISGYEVFDNPDSEFIYYNFMRADGTMGDSKAYYHPRNNWELIHNFKGEDSILMKEVMPDRYAELTRALKGDLTSVSEEGDVMLAFRNSEDSEYYSCLWNAEAHKLWLKRVKSKDALNDWVLSHGRNPGPFIPTWEITFDPQSDIVVNVEDKTINTFICPPLLRSHTEYAGQSWDSIRLLIKHVLGGNKDCIEHFLNHLAVVFQKREKPGTAWILHGTEGTGKGILVNVVLRGILGHYVAIKPAGQLEDQFNEWIERALIGFIDEIEADALVNKSTEGSLRNMVTEPTFSVRRMREAAKEVRSYTMIVMSANRPQPVRIPPNDRRYNVGDYQTVMLKEMLSTRYGITPIEFIKKLQGELGAFTHYLMTRKACTTTAATALMTEAKAKVQELSLTSIDETAHALLTGDFDQLHSCMPDENLLMEMGDQNMIARGYAALMKRWSEEAITRATRDELGVVFEHCCGGTPRSPNKLTSMLRHHGITTKRMKVENGSFYGFEIVWKTSARERKALMPTTQRQTLKRVK